MAATGTHVGGRPTSKQEAERDLAESALFEIGEGRSVLADIIAMSRQFEDALKAEAANVERARVELDEAMKSEQRMRLLNENTKRFASLRLRELVIEEEHLRRLTDELRIDKVHPPLELVRH